MSGDSSNIESVPVPAPNKAITKPGTSTMSRRDFLKLTGFGLGAYLAKKTGAVDFGASWLGLESPEFLKPEIVHGIEVYGLKKEIGTIFDASLLYRDFDKKFDDKLDETLLHKDRVEQRESILERNKRYLEVVVKKSAYESFLNRQQETGCDFVEWIQMHVDLMNRMAENSKPTADISTHLLRVVVISDDFRTADSRSDNLTISPTGFSKDMDATWFIQEDYRIKPQLGSSPNSFYAVYQDENENQVIKRPKGYDTDDKREWTFPNKNDSLKDKEDVWIDMGLIHEWLHQAWNLPDIYWMDVHNSPFRQSEFLIDNGGQIEPPLSPYLSYLIKRANLRNQRGFRTEPEGYGLMKNYENFWLNELPNEIRLSTSNRAEPISAYIPTLIRPDDDSYGYLGIYYGGADFNSPTELAGTNGEVLIKDKDLRKRDGNLVYPVNTILVRAGQKELYMPIAIINMSKISGQDIVSYNVEFSDTPEDPNMRTQIMKFIDSSDLGKFTEALQSQGQKTFAKMKISGTATYCVWWLQE